MTILGLDYGRKKIGLALGDEATHLAEPLEVFRYTEMAELLTKLDRFIKFHVVSKIVIGISDGEIAEEAKHLGKELAKKVEVVFFDETLSTHESQIRAIESGIKRKKRKQMEDAYAAAIILQNYFDS